MIGPEDVYNVKGVDSNGYTFVLSAYDSANETFRISYVDSTTGYNGEIAGRTLYFEVTIISVLQEDPYS
jgi:FKBP-type peptidyl-prolyl cis-trans isomerase 2